MEILKVSRCFVRSGGFSGCWLGRLDKLDRLDRLYRLVRWSKNEETRARSNRMVWYSRYVRCVCVNHCVRNFHW